MFTDYTSEDFWLVKMLAGAALSAVAFFTMMDGSVAENLGLYTVVLSPASQMAQVSGSGGGWDNILEDFDRTTTLRLDGPEWDNTLVRNCTIHNTTGSGIFIRNVSNVRIENCTIHDIAVGGISISSTGSTENVVITGNTIYSIDKDGISAAQRSRSEPPINHVNLVIENNKIYDTGLIGTDGKYHSIYVQAQDFMITDNHIYGDRDGNGISVRSSGVVRNNVVEGRANAPYKGGIKYYSDHQRGPSNTLVIENNIVSNHDGFEDPILISPIASLYQDSSIVSESERVVQNFVIKNNTAVSHNSHDTIKVDSDYGSSPYSVSVTNNVAINTTSENRTIVVPSGAITRDNYTNTSLAEFVSGAEPYDFTLTSSHPAYGWAGADLSSPSSGGGDPTLTPNLGGGGVTQSFVCLSQSGSLEEFGGTYTQKLEPSLSDNKKFDARGATFIHSDDYNWYQVGMRGSNSGMCWAGGYFTNDTSWHPLDATWNVSKNGPGGNRTTAYNTVPVHAWSNKMTWTGMHTYNIHDAVRTTNSNNNWTLEHTWSDYTRDDCLENDNNYSGTVYDVLFDGCYSGISNQEGDGTGQTLVMDKVLLRMEPQPEPYSSVPTFSITGYSEGFGYDNVFKGDTSRFPQFEITNSVFLLEYANGKTQFPPKSKVDVCENNTVIWMGATDNAPTYLLEDFPGCFTIITDDQVGLDLWAEKVVDWHVRHPEVGANRKPANPECYEWPRYGSNRTQRCGSVSGSTTTPPPITNSIINASQIVNSSNNFKVDHGAANLFDGCTSTEIGCSSGTDVAESFWIEFDLGGLYDLNQASIFGDTNGTWQSHTWTLETKLPGESYQPVFNNQNIFGNRWFDESFNKTARYVKLTVTGTAGSGKVQAMELAINGEPAAATPADTDSDGVPDSSDNCPLVSNTDQANYDNDSQGDVCDSDDDNDGIPDIQENSGCQFNPDSQCGVVVEVYPVSILDASHIIASSNNFDIEHLPALLFDNCVLITVGCSTGTDLAESFWIEFDLGGLYDLTAANIFGDTNGTWQSRTWTLETKQNNNDAYQTVFSDKDIFGDQWFAQTLSDTARYVKLTVTGTAGSGKVQAMEFALDGTLNTTPPPVPTSQFAPGDRIQTSDPLKVRETAGGTQIGTQSTGAVGTVLSMNPVDSGGYTYIPVDFDSGVDGWVADAFVTNYTAPPTPTDTDSDGVEDTIDNCPLVSNANQSNFDNDTQGDACDSDDDNDGIADSQENSGCQFNADTQCGVVVEPPSTELGIGSTIIVTDRVRVRETAGLSGKTFGVRKIGDIGTIVLGPTDANGYTWWGIDFDSGRDGWVVGDYITQN